MRARDRDRKIASESLNEAREGNVHAKIGNRIALWTLAVAVITGVVTVFAWLWPTTGDASSPERESRTTISPSDAERAESTTTTLSDREAVGEVRLGSPVSTVTSLLGDPELLPSVPPNPFGITTALLFVRGPYVVEVLANENEAVRYVSVTVRDPEIGFAFPESSFRTFSSKPGDLGESADFFGFHGASAYNYGFYAHLSHSEGYLTVVLGENMFGRLLPDDDEWDSAKYAPTGAERWSVDLPSAECTKITQDVRTGVVSQVVDWTPCRDSVAQAISRQGEADRASSIGNLGSEPEWRDYLANGDFNTVAVAPADLFLEYPAAVFFAIWGVGPREQDVTRRLGE